MENFFVCRKDVQGVEMELVHSLTQLNRPQPEIQPSNQRVVQQRLDETWDSFISRAQRTCQTIISPNVIESYLDKRRFCSLEYNLEGPFHFKALPYSKGEICFQWTNDYGKTESCRANVFKVQTLLIPQMELYIPIGTESWLQIHGSWKLRIDSHNRFYWDCEAGIISTASVSQSIKAAALPEEQSRNQSSPQLTCDAWDKPFEFAQSRRLVRSGQ